MSVGRGSFGRPPVPFSSSFPSFARCPFPRLRLGAACSPFFFFFLLFLPSSGTQSDSNACPSRHLLPRFLADISHVPLPPPPPPPFLSAPCHHGDPGNSSASSSNVLIMPRTISNTMVKPTPCRFVASLYSQVAVRFLLRQVHPLIRFPTTVPLRFFSFLLSFFIHSLSSLFFLFFSRFALD